MEFRSWEDAAFALLPFDWSHTHRSASAARIALEIAERARESRKPLLVFYWSDDERPISVPGAIFFRTSMRKGRDYWHRAFAMPGWLQDPLEVGPPEMIGPRPWESRPRIGFCGLTSPAGSHDVRLRRLRRTVKGIAHLLGLARIPDLTPTLLRRAALDVLTGDQRVDTDFVERDQFFGGAALPDGTYDREKHATVRRDYSANILGTDYTLCIRGAGNFSHRYFDTLAAGRIPILVDTNGGLPFDFVIDWSSCGPIVPASSLRALPGAVLEFHSRLGARGFVERQRENRRLYEKYLSPEGFFSRFPLHFKPRNGRTAGDSPSQPAPAR